MRSHAQKHFLKLEKEGKGDEVPPARPKKRSARSGSAQGPSKAARTNAGRRQDTSGNSTSCKSGSKSSSVQLSTEEGQLGCQTVGMCELGSTGHWELSRAVWLKLHIGSWSLTCFFECLCVRRLGLKGCGLAATPPFQVLL